MVVTVFTNLSNLTFSHVPNHVLAVTSFGSDCEKVTHSFRTQTVFGINTVTVICLVMATHFGMTMTTAKRNSVLSDR